MFVEEKGGARPLMCAQKRAKTSSLSANYAIVLTPEDRPVQPNPFAPRSVRRALLSPQAHAGSLYRCGKGTLRAARGLRQEESGLKPT